MGRVHTFRCGAVDDAMQIFARCPDGASHIVNVDPFEAVCSIRVKVEAQCGIPVAEQVLHFGGVALSEGATVQDCGILPESTLYVTAQLNGGGDGTPAMGKRHKKTHGLCPRCGKRSFHLQNKRCASCGYPAAKMRSYQWTKKARRRRNAGVGRMRYLKTVP